MWVNFTHATKWQAEGIFKCFFPSKPAVSSSTSTSTGTGATSQEKTDVSQKNLPLPKRKVPGNTIPILEEAEIAELAKRFADAIPEGELSVSLHLESGFGPLTQVSHQQVAALQGYLLKNKVRPRECVDEVGDWSVHVRNFQRVADTHPRIIKERETREKLKKEKAEVRLHMHVSFPDG